MAAAVFGGSPRHHSRSMSGSQHTMPKGSIKHSPNPLQLPSASAMLANTAEYQSSKINFPLSTYITASTPTSSHQYHQQQKYQIGSAGTLPPPPSVRRHHHHNKRKSAVELLAESKPFYVKSETVLERQQQFNYRGTMSPSRVPITTYQRNSNMNRRSASTSSSSDLLQNKLRNLLDAASDNNDPSSLMNLQDLNAKYEINKFMSPKKLNQELSINPGGNNETSFFFPSAFLSPQSLPPHPVSDDDIYSYSEDNSLTLTDNYDTISPPAEYAEADSMKIRVPPTIRYSGYQRSYSHSQAVASNEGEYSPSFNINSHKSLPDLHSQICRHSPHSEVLSCCSRGNRSNKSGSTFNRDSGGSSGHYTHRSEPCCKQQQQIDLITTTTTTTVDFRRDSGSSTQHSGNSYYAYGLPPVRYDCIECRTKIQDDVNCLLNFTTLEVPEAFQDDYDTVDKDPKYYSEPQSEHYSQNVPPLPPPPVQDSNNDLSPPLGTFKRQRCLRMKQRNRYYSPGDRNCRSEDDRRPILRSKSDICDRYWQRPTTVAPILSAPETKSSAMAGLSMAANPTEPKRSALKSDSSGGSSVLERFFEHLGLNDDAFDEFYQQPAHASDIDESDNSSPVFFSDTSTVDSNRLADTAAETNPNTQPIKPSEPPSIVERNARIIKWLCNCRKFHGLM